MYIHIHRLTINRFHTVSELRFPGGTLHVVEPPLAGFSASGPHAVLPGEHSLYLKPLLGTLRPCFPKMGKKYRFYMAPQLEPVHVDDVSFDCPYLGYSLLKPLYAGFYDDEGWLHPDMEQWESFCQLVADSHRRHEPVRVTFTV